MRDRLALISLRGLRQRWREPDGPLPKNRHHEPANGLLSRSLSAKGGEGSEIWRISNLTKLYQLLPIFAFCFSGEVNCEGWDGMQGFDQPPTPAGSYAGNCSEVRGGERGQGFGVPSRVSHCCVR